MRLSRFSFRLVCLLLPLFLSTTCEGAPDRNRSKRGPLQINIPFFQKKKPSSKFENLTNRISQKVATPNNNNNNNKQSHQELHLQQVLQYVIQNLLAGLASAIALIPEASTFAMTAGLSPLVGLGSTVVLATLSGSLGGRPGLVSGATATVAMILKPLAASIANSEEAHLLQSLTVILAGLLQLALGSTKCAKYIRVIPQPVMMGFVNGLSVKVLMAQIPHFQQHHHHDGGSGVWLQGAAMKWHSILVLLSALVIDFLPKLTTAVPSSLVALCLATVVTNMWNLPVPRLVDMVGPEAFQGGLDTLQQALFPFFKESRSIFPPFQRVLTAENLALAIPTAIEMAVVGLLQSLLTLQIIDNKTNTKGRTTKESIAQGFSNVVSGSMGGMGGSALLGQSLVNVNAGGTGRLSSISVALFVMLGITFCAPLLGGIPVAALVGLMLTVAQHSFHWRGLENIVKGQVPPVDVLIIVSVSYATAFVNMAAAVGLGVLASALRFAWQASCNMSARESDGGINGGRRYIRVSGPLFFGSTTTFEKLCRPSGKDRDTAAELRVRMANRRRPNEEPLPSILETGREVVIDFSESQVWDHAAIKAIESVALQYHELGVKLRLRRLSPDCREKLLDGSNIGELSTELDVDPANDPTYLVGEDPKTRKKQTARATPKAS